MAEFKTEVKIGAEIDGLKSGLNEAQNAIKGLGESVNSSTGGMSEAADRAGQSFNSLGYAMKTSIVYGGIYEAISLIKNGLESLSVGALKVASTFEDMNIGIAALIAANHQNVTAEGDSITSAQKYAWAKEQAADAVKKLRLANLQTPATLTELTIAFQNALAPAQSFGLSMDQTVKYTTAMSQAAYAMQVPMNQLAQEVRAVFEGDTSRNSRINSILQIKSDAIEAHKAAGDLFPFLMKKLEDFGQAGYDINHSMSGSLSNVSDSYDALRNTLVTTTGAFNHAKEAIDSVNKLIINHDGELNNLIRHTSEVGAVIAATYITTLGISAVRAFIAFRAELEASTAAQLAFNAAVKTNAYIIIAAEIATIISELYEYKTLLGEINVEQGKAAGSANFLKDIKGMAGKDTGEKLDETIKRSQALKKEQEQLIATLNEHKKYAYQSSKNDEDQKARQERIEAITAEQKALVSLAESLKKKKAEESGAKDNTPKVKEHEETDKEKALRLKLEKEAEALAEKIQEINDQTVSLKLDGLAKELSVAQSTYDKEIHAVGKSVEGQAAAAEHLKAQKESIMRKYHNDMQSLRDAESQAITGAYTKESEKLQSEYFKRLDHAAISYREDMRKHGETTEGKLLVEKKFNSDVEAARIEFERKTTEESAKKLEKDRHAKLVQIELEKETALSLLQIQIDNLDASRAQNKITELELLEGKKAFEDKKFAIEMDAAIKRTSLVEGDVEKVKAAKDRELKVQQDYAKNINKSNNDIATQAGATYRSMMATITDTVGSSIGQVLNGTMKVKSAMMKILTDLLGMFTQFIGKQVAAHLLGEQTMSMATMMTNAKKMLGITATTTAAVTSDGIKTASAVTSAAVQVSTQTAASAAIVTEKVGEATVAVGANAAVAASGAAAAVAPTPFIGPFLAIAAFAATAGLVLGAKKMFSAEGGFDIPNGVNPMTQLHQNEMVLPAEHANTIRNLGANGGGGGHNITINAVDAKGVRDLFMNHGSALMESIKNQGRNFNR